MKVKKVEDTKKAKEEHKLKLKEYIARGEKWYKADHEEKKQLIDLKRQVPQSLSSPTPRPAVLATTTSPLRPRSHLWSGSEGKPFWKHILLVLTPCIPSPARC